MIMLFFRGCGGDNREEEKNHISFETRMKNEPNR